MATNFIRDGEFVKATVPSGTTSGGPVLINGIPGVAQKDRDSSGYAPVDFRPGVVYQMTVNAVDDDGNSAVAEGDELFFTAGDTIKLSKKKSGTFWGRAQAAVPGGSTTLISAGSSGSIYVAKGGDAGQGSTEGAHIADAAVTAANPTADAAAVTAANPDAMAAQTQNDLTDNGGGTADQTVDDQSAPTTLTDSSGLDATHDDTIAAITNTDDLTNSTGGSADDTLDAVTQQAGGAGVELTDGDAAKINNNFTEIADQLATQKTLNAVLAQNQSDVAQKVIELVTLAGTAQNNLKEVTTELALIKTDVAAAKTAVDANNAQIDALVTDVTSAQAAVVANNASIEALVTDVTNLTTKLNAVLKALEYAGILASA